MAATATLIAATFGAGDLRAAGIQGLLNGLKVYDLKTIVKTPKQALNRDVSYGVSRLQRAIDEQNRLCQEAAQECINEHPPVWLPESNNQRVTWTRDIDRCIAEKEQGCEKVCEDARPGDPLQYPVQYEFPPESGVVHAVQCYDEARISAVFGYCLADTMTTTQVLESPDETAYYCFGGVTYDYRLYDLHRSTTGGDHACVLGEGNGMVLMGGSSMSFEDSRTDGIILLDGSSVSFEGTNYIDGLSTCINRPGDDPTHRACLDAVQENDNSCIVTLEIESFL